MGFISGYANKDLPGSSGGRQLWEQVFGSVSKEEGHHRPVRPATSSRSVLSENNAFKRLLQAMRSMAPGGPSDDRWEQTKHFVGIAYVAIHRSSEQLAQSEFKVYLKDENHPDGKRPVPRYHPAFAVNRLLEHPNREDSWGDLMYRWNQQMDMTGKALTWWVPNRMEEPMEFYSIPTAIAIPQPAINPDFPDGFYRIQPVYPYGPFSNYPTPSSAVGAPIPAQWMSEMKYPHPLLRYDGYSPMTALRLELDEFEMIGKSRHSSMRRAINPSAVLNFDTSEEAQPLDEEEIERIVAQFESDHQGPENQGKLYVAYPGGRLDPWPVTAKDMDYPGGWEQLAGFILGGGFGITKQASGMIEDAAYATLFATMKQLHLITLQPKCRRVGHRLTRFLSPFYGEELVVEVECPRIDDHEILFNKIGIAMQAKAIKKNQLLKLLELPMTREPWGEDMAGDPTPMENAVMMQEQMMQMQAGAGGVEGEGPPPEEQGPGPEEQGEESLGPRKHLKSLYAEVREACCV